MIIGMVSMHDYTPYVLFELGVIHSFIAQQFVKLMGLEPKSLGVVFRFTTPFKEKVLTVVGCSGCKLIIGGRAESIDLIVLEMYDFDIIIGMD